MHVEVIIGSSSQRTYTVVDENGDDLDLVAAGIVKIEFCAHGRVLSSDTDSVSYQNNEIKVNFGDFELDHYSDVTPIVKFYKADGEFEALKLRQNGNPVTLSFISC